MKKNAFNLMLFIFMSVTGYSQSLNVANDGFEGVEASLGDKIADCKYKDVTLYGKVKVVNSFPDFKVKIVNSFPDLKVKIVESFPDACGKWKMVDSFPDFTIQFVDSFPDFTIKMVESFPGMP